MIPMLYSENERTFSSNGIGPLSDALTCFVEQELNGIYELEMQYPVQGVHFADIKQRSIMLAKPDPVAEAQPFRVYRITKPSKGTVTVYARHVAYDLAGVTVSPFTAQGTASALDGLSANAVIDCPFQFYTDKAATAAFKVAVPSTVWSLLGGSKGSVLDTFGGEYEFDRWTIKLLNRRGADRGVSIRYGKNLTTLEQDENCANCYTGVYPYWLSTDGVLVQLPEKVVNASGTYPYTRIKPLDLSGEWENAPTEDQLRTRAEKYVTDNDIGKPAISWQVSFVPLEQTEEYKDMAMLERVLLGDTVSVAFPALNVSASARVVVCKYNVLLDRYESVTLGSVKANIADTIAEQSKEIQRKPGKTEMQIAIGQLTSSILGATGGVVRFLDTNGDGTPDTLYIADNADPAQAVKVWRFNYEGWGASENGYNGPFVLGATIDGGIVADFITAGVLNGTLIKTGVITSSDGTISIDLTNNEITIREVGTGGTSFIVLSADGIVAHDTIDGVETETFRVRSGSWGTTSISSRNPQGITLQSVSGGPTRIGAPTTDTQILGAKLMLKGKTVSWQDNGDGTCTLIGQ